MQHPSDFFKLVLLVTVIIQEIKGAVLINSVEQNSTNNDNSIINLAQNNTKENAITSLSKGVEARKKEQDKNMMSKILPMMVIPFMVSTGMIPMMLVSLKFMLLQKAELVDKVEFLLIT